MSKICEKANGRFKSASTCGMINFIAFLTPLSCFLFNDRENRNMSKGEEEQDMTTSCPDCGHKVPDGREICIYCGAPQREGVFNTKSKTDTIEEIDFSWTFSSDKPRRRIRFSPLIQALIFIMSAAIGGFLVFLMM